MKKIAVFMLTLALMLTGLFGMFSESAYAAGGLTHVTPDPTTVQFIICANH